MRWFIKEYPWTTLFLLLAMIGISSGVILGPMSLRHYESSEDSQEIVELLQRSEALAAAVGPPFTIKLRGFRGGQDEAKFFYKVTGMNDEILLEVAFWKGEAPAAKRIQGIYFLNFFRVRGEELAFPGEHE